MCLGGMGEELVHQLQQVGARGPDGEELYTIIHIVGCPAPSRIRPGPSFPEVSHSGLPEDHFQTNFGAVIWMQPISAFCWKEDFDLLADTEQHRLSLLQTWDCQSNH